MWPTALGARSRSGRARRKTSTARLLEAAELAAREVELQEPVREAGVVLEVRVDSRSPVPVRPLELPVGREGAEEEVGQPVGDGEVVGPLEAPRRFGEGGEREPVPCGDDLIVARRLR